MNLEATSDDNYLKTHNIQSAVNNNQSLLNSFQNLEVVVEI